MLKFIIVLSCLILIFSHSNKMGRLEVRGLLLLVLLTLVVELSEVEVLTRCHQGISGSLLDKNRPQVLNSGSGGL